jgi:hypothetical protein
MVSWVALFFALGSSLIALVALGIALWVYFKGPRVKNLDPDELFDLLLEQNDTNVLFKEEPMEE